MNHIAIFLRDISFNKKTGRLIFKHASILKYFFFQKGALIQVKTNQPEERVGEVLFKMERLSEDAHDRIDEYIEPSKNIGEVLRSRGLVSEQDLSDALTQQMREAALNTFAFFDAEISFQEREDFDDQAHEAKISVPFLIEYGIRRMQFDPALKGFLARKIPFLKKKSFAYLLTPDEKDILDKLTGSDTAESVLRSLTAPPDLFWKTLYLFYCLDLVDFKPEEEAVPGPANRASAPSPDGIAAPPEISEVMALRENLANKTFYQILDVPRTASEEEIKKAYFHMARRFHPDRSLAAEYKTQINEVFDAITNAYRLLSNKEKKAAYDSGVGMTSHEDFQDVVKRAEIKFRQGKTLFGIERFDEAVSLLEEAVRMRKDKADYFLLLAMAEARVPSYLKKAEADFLKAIALEPWNPEGYYGLGHMYKTEGLVVKAIRQFEKALEADPEHGKARKELRELGAEETKKKGLQALFPKDFLKLKKKKK